MKNKEMADKISEKYGGNTVFPTEDECIAYSAAMEMAEWKDERAKSCFILISKLIKGGVLTKDNPEHIMVEQMMELYNNLKI